MDFEYDAKTVEMIGKLEAFMDEVVYPAEPLAHDQMQAAIKEDSWSPPAVLEDLKAEAKKRGLWNFFLPGEDGAGLTNLQYAPLAEITGRSIQLAPAAVNCAAPDTGNMEVLHMFGTPEQKEKWLTPLLAGEIRSSFAMTEPKVASSDATNIETSIIKDGDDYVINGTKWWITGAMNPNAKIFIVMGKTDTVGRAPPSAVDDPGRARHPGLRHQARDARVRLQRPRSWWSRRDRVHRRTRARQQPDRRRG